MYGNSEKENTYAKICVLMTTYNPSFYLMEQVESIFKQKDVEVQILIRDDASENKEFLNKVKENKNVFIIEGKYNLGVNGNIAKLVSYAKKHMKDVRYFAYSDQDDVWMEDKLRAALKYLKRMDAKRPRLYYGNLLVVDENLVPSHELQRRGVVKNTFAQGLAQIFLFACTAVFDRHMLESLSESNINDMGFDHYLYYMGILTANVYYDDIPHLFYRQHGDNVSGVKKKGIAYFMSKISVLSEKRDQGGFVWIAQYLLKEMSQYMNEKDIELVKQVASLDRFGSRINLIRHREIKAGYFPKDFYRTLRILFHRY